MDISEANRLLAEVAAVRNLRIKDVLSTKRNRPLVEARRELYLKLRAAGVSYPTIGVWFERDHTTIMSAVRGKVAMGALGPYPSHPSEE